MSVLFKSKKPKDFYTGDIPTKNATKKLVIEEHHVFPVNSEIGKQIADRYKSINDNIINNIANIVLITKETNNKRISNKNPSVYIKEFMDQKEQEQKIEDFYAYLDTHFISKNMVQLLLDDNFEDFLVVRTKLIYDYIVDLTSISNE